ncbi:MAG: DHH family phosphoesterase [Actinobacteria bacterium]|nr:DHH family phosphoesterase [Actinomycetota bacterium]
MKALPADLAAVCRRMKTERSVGLAVHERPDTDALAAAAGMLDLFAQLGVEARLHVDRDEVLPLEELLLPLGTVTRGLPPARQPLYALDCGSLERLALPLTSWGGLVVNIDHHHDNTRFGDLVYVRGEASSTSELVCDIARALGLRPSQQSAEALFAGISFDTGHFRHDSTSAATFATAAWLTELGVGVTRVFSMLYEQGSLEALHLWARAIAGAQAVACRHALVATLTLADYAAVGAAEEETEGIVDSLRSIAGVEVAALVKEQSRGPRVRASLRSNGHDVSAIAALKGGGGHRLAAGFSSDDGPEEVTAWLSSELEKRLLTASF